MEEHSTNRTDPIDAVKADIVFRYYEDQWEQVRHHENIRSSMTLQILIVVAALIATYLQSNGVFLKCGVSVGIIALGILGLALFIDVRAVTQTHVKRARAARKSLGFLEEFASFRGFRKLHVYYSLLYVLIMLIGVILLLSVIL